MHYKTICIGLFKLATHIYIRDDMRARLQQYNKMYDDMTRLFSELQQIGDSKGQLDNVFDKLIRIEVLSTSYGVLNSIGLTDMS